ncbi:flavin reductase family protein [Azonexus sp.]|uniref:flavin reductase family protein n=1 Tax=Azonexus sp. TaxID=1872668 RepID=UPI0039E247A7
MSQTSPPPAEIDSRALRQALGQFATGIAVVTALDTQGQPIGLTVNSFSAVSLTPPLVLWCLDNRSHNLAAFQGASHHAINILARAQEDISNRFATWPTDRFAGLKWCANLGAPVLSGCCAHFVVANETCHLSGDHSLFIGRIEHFSADAQRAPLLFHAGQYRALAENA